MRKTVEDDEKPAKDESESLVIKFTVAFCPTSAKDV